MADAPPTRRSSDAERRARAARVLRARERGDAWPVIAEREGISERQAHRAKDEALEAGGLRCRLDAGEIVARLWIANELALEVLEREAVAADNSSARVGSCRAIAAVSGSMIDLAERAGVRVRLFQNEPDLRVVARAVLAVADEHGLGEPVTAALNTLMAPVTAAATRELPVGTGASS